MSAVRTAAPTWRDSLGARTARQRLVRDLDRDQILAAAEASARLGDRHLAVGLVRDLLVCELKPYAGDAYRPGELMNRVLGPLGVWVEARAHEYRRALRELLPDDEASLHDDSPIKTLAQREHDAIPVDFEATETAEAIVEGAPYSTALETYVQRLRRAAADARNAELEWLSERVRLRYAPGDDGFGRLWRSAQTLVESTVEPGTTLPRPIVERVIVRLASAADNTEAIAALAAGLASAGDSS